MNIVLHVCCGVCAAGAVKALIEEGHQVIGYFYNPNIHPEAEYLKRLEAARRVSQELHFPLEIASYNPDDWFKETEQLKQEPEGGARCPVCFRMRLGKTFAYLNDCGADAFTTTLTISPHKSAAIVNKIGQDIGGDKFLARDFKKQEGFKKAAQLAREWHIYQQNYCGCRYSIRKAKY